MSFACLRCTLGRGEGRKKKKKREVFKKEVSLCQTLTLNLSLIRNCVSAVTATTTTQPGIQAHHVRASISEYNEPWPGKTRPVTVYGNGTYRLETNSQLYEGARYAWIIVDPAPDGTPFTPWEITAVRLVVQTKPVSYTGSFKSADKVLTGSWYSGAYGSRTNMMPDVRKPNHRPILYIETRGHCWGLIHLLNLL